MTAIWRALLAALATQALGAPWISVGERALAGLALACLLATRRAIWPALVGALLGIGVAAAWRHEAIVAQRWADRQLVARVRVLSMGRQNSAVLQAAATGYPSTRIRLRGSRVAVLQVGACGVAALQIDPLLGARNPDDRDPRRMAMARGVLSSARLLQFAAECEAPTPSALGRVRLRALGSFERRFAGSAPLWKALLLGDRTQLDPSLAARVRKLGLSHILSLSGMHVALLLGILAFARPGRRVPLWALAPLALWIVLAGGGAALLRSGAMAAWMLLGRHWQRVARADDALAFAAWLDLAANPGRTADIGWWLSYAATYALIRSAALLRLRHGVGALCASLAATGATLPWSIAVFGQIVWLSPFVNLAIAAPFGVLMVGGAICVLLGALLPLSAPIVDPLLQLATHLFGALLLLLDRCTPPALGHPGLHGWQWGMALLLFFFAFLRRPIFRWRLGLLVVALALLHLPLLQRPATRWWSLDVGQGDAGVLHDRGQWLLVDSGPIEGSSTQAERVLLPFLERRNVRGASFAITHGHLDHMGGAASLLRSGRIARLVLAASDSSLAWTAPLRESCNEEGIDLLWTQRGDTLQLGEVRLPVLWPPAFDAPEHANDRSLVLLAGPPRARLLLCGDLERGGEAACLSAGAPRDVVVLKVAHHGGDTGSDLPWLQALAPRFALLSCGRGNRYGHPHPAVLDRLRRAEIAALRTDHHGALEVRWVGDQVGLHMRRP